MDLVQLQQEAPETFDKTVLTVTAYPGMNFVSWTPVVDAKSYTLFKHEGNVCVEAISFGSTSSLYYVDIDIKNGVEYSYLVEVELNPSSSYINDYADVEIAPAFPKQMSERAFVTAIVPDHTVNALKLTEFENPTGNADFVVKPENMHIAKHHTYEGDMISYSFPGKAYLEYEVFITRDNEYETIKDFEATWAIHESDPCKNNVIFSNRHPIFQSGEYKLVVVASAVNEQFAPSDYIISSESVKVEQLNGSGVRIASARYTDIGDGKTIRVIFDEFKLENGTSVPMSYYKLYRSEKGTRLFTLVDAQVKATDSTNKQFFVDDKISDNKKDYVYALVVTDGTLYADDYWSENVPAYEKQTQNTPEIVGTQISSDEIRWTITLHKDVTISSAYTLEKSPLYIEPIVPADFYDNQGNYVSIDSGTTVGNYTTYTTTTKHSEKNNIYLLVVTEQSNKTIGEWVEGPYVLGPSRTAQFNDENGNMLSTITVLEQDGYRLEIPEFPSKDGYVALYWESNGNTYQPNQYVTLLDSVTVFTCKYRQLGTRRAFFRDESGFPFADINTITVKESLDNYSWHEIKLPEIPYKSGYTALYWRESSSGNNIYAGNNTYLTSNETYFIAVYQSDSSEGSGSQGGSPGYQVETRVAYFQDEYGNTIAGSITVDNDGSDSWNRVTLPSIPGKPGYNGCWSYNGEVYYPGDSYSVYSTTTTFTAVYEPNLTVGSDYQIGYTDGSGEVYYTFYVQAGYSYNVYWMDGYSNGGGNSELENLLSDNSIVGDTLDVKVSIYSEDESHEVCSEEDSGFNNPQNFTAQTTGYYVVKVEPYSSGNSGYFAVKVEETY